VRLYSDGTKRISEELQALVNTGDAEQRLLCWFDGAAFIIDVEQPDDGALAIDADGRVLVLPQQELEVGMLPVRRWLRVLDMPPGALFENISPFFVEAASYQAEKGGLRLESKSDVTAWDIL
jgi:hypothetical protein